MARTKVTENELLELLRQAEPSKGDRPTGVWTTTELAKRESVSPSTMRDRLRPLVEDGLIDVVSFRKVAMDGRSCRVRGYRLKTNAAS